MPFVGQDWRADGCRWVRIDGHWITMTENDYQMNESTFSLSSNAITCAKSTKKMTNRNIQKSVQETSVQSAETENDYKPWQPILRNVQGMGKERRCRESLSSAMKILDIETYGLELQGFRYCLDIYMYLLERKFDKVSGTAQRHLFKCIEEIVSTAIRSEIYIPLVKSLVETALTTLCERKKLCIGSKLLWKKHWDAVNNCRMRVNMFEYTERQVDDKPTLLDLPKETLQKILSYMTDPRDVLNAGSTCWRMHEVSEDMFIWRSLCLYHFNEKQLCSFVYDLEFCEIDWLDIFIACVKRKYKLNKQVLYGDELVICSNCRCIFWKAPGHVCANPEMLPFHTKFTPEDFVELFRL